MLTIHLQAIDSRRASQAELDAARLDASQIPHDADGTPWELASHQAQTIEALRTSNAPIIINTAATGDGKTLAGRLPLLNDKMKTFAMYPTNALAYDQKQGFHELLDTWQPPAWNRPVRERLINAREINDFSFGTDAVRLEELIALLRRKDYILTNPDIFHLILNFAYQKAGTAPDLMPAFVSDRFQLYIFDEFHLFGVEQIAAVMIAILFLRQLTPDHRQPRFLFLSATPQSLLQDLAYKAGLAYATPISGDYEHGSPEPPPGYRRILRQTTLTVHTADSLEDWIETHSDIIIQAFFADNQAATGVIIGNSVATVHRVYAYLKPLCEKWGIQLAINTGITPRSERESRDFDLLVATSTVDVGVDFKINFLIFESRDAASHMQRLGRLGRHQTNRVGEPFKQFEAHALVPGWTLDGLKDKFSPQESVSREAYESVIQEYFSPTQQFESYIYRWAGVQAGRLLHQLHRKEIHTQYRQTAARLEDTFKTLFKGSVTKYISLFKNKNHHIIDAAASFRGNSPFTALVQHQEENYQEVMSYNLITLLRRADLTAVPVDEMLKRAASNNQNIESLKKTNPLSACYLNGWIDNYRDIIIQIDIKIPDNRLNTVIEQRRFSIHCEGIPELWSLNQRLAARLLVAFIIPDKLPFDVKRALRLGVATEIFAFRGMGQSGTIAFGRDALLVDSVYRRRKSQNALFW